MVITNWSNEIQKAVIREWTEGCQDGEETQDIQALRNGIAKRYGLTVSAVRAIVELIATEGLSRTRSGAHLTDGHTWEPINYHELVGDLKERVKVLERKFEYLLDGIQKVLEDGETMRAHVQQLRGMSKWMKKRDAFLPEIESQNTISDRESPSMAVEPATMEAEVPKGERREKRDPMEKIDKLRTQADNAFKRGKLLFQEIEEGKKAIPD